MLDLRIISLSKEKRHAIYDAIAELRGDNLYTLNEWNNTILTMRMSQVERTYSIPVREIVKKCV